MALTKITSTNISPSITVADALVVSGNSYPQVPMRSSTRNWVSYVHTGSGTYNIKDETAALDRLVVDTAGRITMPYQPAFAATLNTNVASGASAQVVALNNAITNVGSCFNTSTYRFTAPVAGSYQIQFKWESISGTAPLYSELNIRKNGTMIMYGIAKKDANSTEYTAMIGRVIYLNANDYLEVYYTAGGGILAGESYTVFSGHLLG